MGKMLLGAFADRDQADKALVELEEQGYAPEEISAISATNKYEKQGYDSSASVAKTAGAGAVTGGVIGGLAGLLAGVGVIPALAGLFIGGPIAAALGFAGVVATTASGAVTGAAAGGLIGALTGMGVSRETATSYDKIVKEGGVVLGLSGHEEISRESRAIFEKYGAQDISLVDMREEGAAAAEQTSESQTAPRRAEPAFGERRDVREDSVRENGMREDDLRQNEALDD